MLMYVARYTTVLKYHKLCAKSSLPVVLIFTALVITPASICTVFTPTIKHIFLIDQEVIQVASCALC